MYNKEAYIKLKLEKPEKLKEYAHKAYLKLKEKNPEKIKEYASKSYEKMKVEKPEQLRKLRCHASKLYYERNREKVISNVIARKHKKTEALENEKEKDLGVFEIDLGISNY